MDNEIAVGAVVGLITASSLYVWNSDEFTKEQKTFLLIAMVFAPVQWVGILVIKYYNNYRKNNSLEKVTERKVSQVKSSLDNSISNLRELKNKGIITENEYKNKVQKIEEAKTEQNLKNSLEYSQLKSLLDNGVLTKDEFDSKVYLLTKVSGKEVDTREINKIIKSVNNTYIDSTKEKSDDKKDTNIRIYKPSTLIILAVLCYVIIYIIIFLLPN